MAADMTNMTKIQSYLNDLLTKSNAEEAKNSLELFKKDEWFMIDQVQSLAETALRNTGAGNAQEPLMRLAEILDYIVIPEYAVEDPVILSPIYSQAIRNPPGNKVALPNYSLIRQHINNMFKVEPSLVTKGVTARSGSRSNDSSSSPFYYEEGSYCGLISTIYTDSSRKFTVAEAIGALEKAIAGDTTATPSQPALVAGNLVEAGFVKTIMANYNKNKDDLNNFKLALSTTENVIKNLNSKGFDIYRKETMSKIVDAISNGKIEEFDMVTKYYNKNALILNFGLRLQKE